MAFVLTAPWTKGRASSPYLTVSWIFVAVYAVFGFLGPYQAVGFDYQLAQLIVKLWIGVVGIPWLAMRVVDRNRLPIFLKSSVLVCAMAGPLALAQVLFPRVFAPIVSEPGRGAAYWVNPNNCGVICGMMLFVALYCPFRSKTLNIVIRTLLLMGVFLSLSRGGIVGLAVGTVVYGVMAKRIRTVITLSIATAIFIIAGKFALDVIGAESARAKSRMERFEAVLTGDLGESSTARVILWKYGFDAVKRDWLIGRGHGSMVRVVPLGSGYGPHNYYLFVWGNSGFVALLAFLAWLFVLFRYGFRAGDSRSKATLLALAAMLAAFAMFDHSYVAHQFMGSVLAVVALAGHFAQPEKTVAHAATRAGARAGRPPTRPA